MNQNYYENLSWDNFLFKKCVSLKCLVYILEFTIQPTKQSVNISRLQKCLTLLNMELTSWFDLSSLLLFYSYSISPCSLLFLQDFTYIIDLHVKPFFSIYKHISENFSNNLDQIKFCSNLLVNWKKKSFENSSNMMC